MRPDSPEKRSDPALSAADAGGEERAKDGFEPGKDAAGEAGLTTLEAAAAPGRDYLRLGAAIFVGLALLAIVAVSLTDLAAVFLPMDERYLNVLIPRTADGSEPFVLNELTNVLEDNHLSVSGRITNRSLEAVEKVVAVISATETTGRFPEVIEAPVEPSPLAPGESGTFSVSVTLRQKPNSYTVRFKLEQGPFVPHRDERGLPFEFVPGP